MRGDPLLLSNRPSSISGIFRCFFRCLLELEEVDLVKFYASAAVAPFAKSFHFGPNLFDFRGSMVRRVVVLPAKNLNKEWSTGIVSNQQINFIAEFAALLLNEIRGLIINMWQPETE
jgi:hypothetical protein